MANTPRDVDAYWTDITASVERQDPSLDMQKGPLAVLAYGVATAGSQQESFSAYLQSLYQLSDPTLIADEDIYELALNFGKDPNIARVSRGTVYFYRTARPEAGVIYPATEGTIVSTDDGRFNFIVVEGNEMNGDLADSYFNSEEGWYEIPTICEAVAAGTDYDLPPTTVNTIQTVQDNFDGCTNKDYLREGDDPPDKFAVRNIIWNSTQGVNQDTAGQIETIITDISPTGVDDYMTVPSTDFAFYPRLGQTSGKLGYDIYLITDRTRDTVEHDTALGGETFLSFKRKPVLTVDYVAVDGVGVPFSLDVDTTDAWRGSPRANDRVQLATALQPGQVWEIRYLYYDVVYDVHQAMQNRLKIFSSDTLVRLADSREVYVAGEATVFATADRDSVIDGIRNFTISYLQNPQNPSIGYSTFVTGIDPLDYQRSVEGNVDGVQQFKLSRFIRLDGAVMDIEFLSFDGRTEYPVLAVNFDVT